MKVKFIYVNRLFAHEPGDVVELTDQDGQTLINSGHAVLATDEDGQPAERIKAEPQDQSHVYENEIRPDGGETDTTFNKLDRNALKSQEETITEGEGADSEGLEGNPKVTNSETAELPEGETAQLRKADKKKK